MVRRYFFRFRVARKKIASVFLIFENHALGVPREATITEFICVTPDSCFFSIEKSAPTTKIKMEL